MTDDIKAALKEEVSALLARRFDATKDLRKLAELAPEFESIAAQLRQLGELLDNMGMPSA